MRLTVFHVGDGDCILLSATSQEDAQDATQESEHHMLIDGGRRTAFRDHARDFLYRLPRLDVVCVSHIDEDHISGILGLLKDEIAWRVFDFAQETFEAGEGPEPRAPRFPRPPAIGEIWHNALFELVGEDLEVEVQGALATSASLLAGSAQQRLQDLASHLDNLATGERSALELSRRISGNQLNIPRNRPNGEVMLRGAGADAVNLGPLTLRILGPSEDDIKRLRVAWAKWIRDNQEALGRLRREMLRDEESLGMLPASIVANPMLEASLGEGLSSVTEPNLSSLMLLVEEGETTVLLTGDGVSSEILEGLEHHGKAQAGEPAHVTVLKVQHHGALANITEEFVRRVSADHYLFCGNGAHHNPELEAVESLARARLQGIAGSAPVGPDEDFKFWFTSSPRTPGLSAARKKHMEDLEALLQRIQADENPAGRFSFEMLDRGRFGLDL